MKPKNRKLTDAQKRGEFIVRTRNESRKEINKMNGNVTKEQRRKIIRKQQRKVILAMTFTSFLSFLAGGTSVYLLNEGIQNSKKEITIDADDYPEGIKIENVKNDKQVWLDGINAREYVKYGEIKDLKQKINEKINSFNSADELLNYIKSFYLDEYNENAENPITEENITINAYYNEDSFIDYSLYEDTATNGDKIIRKCYGKDSVPEGKNGISNDDFIQVEIVRDDGAIEREMAVYSYENGKYTEVYDYNQEVSSYQDGILTDVGSILRNGIAYYSEVTNEQDPNSERAIQQKQEFKESFIDNITTYKESKIEKQKEDELDR